VRDEPGRQTSNPPRSRAKRGRWISCSKAAPDVPPAARDRPAAALILLSGSSAVVWTTGIAQLPRGQAVELLTYMAHAPVAATLAAWYHPRRRQP
jgi:hypothetical protein